MEFEPIDLYLICNTGTVLCQLSHQANWELLTFWVHNTPVYGEEYKLIYERLYIWTVEQDMTYHCSYTHNLYVIVKLKPVGIN